MRRVTISLIVVVLCSTAAFARKAEEACRHASGEVGRRFGIYSLQIKPAVDEDNQPSCKVVLKSADGREVFQANDFALSVDPISGASVTNDGNKSVVLEGFSGGAHCCWTYWIVNTSGSAGLVREIRNQTPVLFERENGRVVIMTNDGVFDYFDDLPHVNAPMPGVYLELKGKKLVDVSPEFSQDYDKRINEVRQNLSPERIKEFRSGAVPDLKNVSEQTAKWMETKGLILTIVLNYLYSGREQEAWNTLDEMWPPADRERITQLIVDTKSKGILSDTTK